MDSVTVILADTILTATMDQSLWQVAIRDALTGKTERREWTNVQLASVLGMLVGAEEGSDEIEALRPNAEEACLGFEPEVSPIP